MSAVSAEICYDAVTAVVLGICCTASKPQLPWECACVACQTSLAALGCTCYPCLPQVRTCSEEDLADAIKCRGMQWRCEVGAGDSSALCGAAGTGPACCCTSNLHNAGRQKLL